MSKPETSLADTAARLVEAIGQLHERIALVEDAIIAIDDRTRPHTSKSMKPRLRHTASGWQPTRNLESAGEAMDRLGVTRVRQDANGDWQAA